MIYTRNCMRHRNKTCKLTVKRRLVYEMEVLEPIGRLFYIVSPNKTSFETVEEVPYYVDGAVPDICILFLLEISISMCLGWSNIRVNETIACLSQGIIYKIFGIFAPGGQLVTYYYIHSNWKIADLPWNAASTWWICFLGVDFTYYWLHRAAHEVNFLWATHQVHHSSEDYNLSANARQSVLQHFYLWVAYMPLALVIPPSVFVVHVQFAYIYQFWIHTELIRSLGPLEFILNTASHHRVHHGANRICIDKNFGGTLIIWDRLFGTFAPEKEGIVYGLTQPVNTFEPMRIQFDHCAHMWKMFRQCKGWKDKLSVLFKGPGWSPGKPRLGDPNDIPDLKAPANKYDKQLSGWGKVYVILHFLLLIQGYLSIMDEYHEMPDAVLHGIVSYEIFSLVSIGIFLDQSFFFPWSELGRCILYFFLDTYFQTFSSISLTAIYARWTSELIVRFVLLSTLMFWLIYCSVGWKFQHKIKRIISGEKQMARYFQMSMMLCSVLIL